MSCLPGAAHLSATCIRRRAAHSAFVFATLTLCAAVPHPACAGALFSLPMQFAVNPGPYGIARADFDEDGRADLVTANYGDNYNGTTPNPARGGELNIAFVLVSTAPAVLDLLEVLR